MEAQIRGVFPGANSAPSEVQESNRVLVKFFREAMPGAPISPLWPYLVRLVRVGGTSPAYVREMVKALNETLGPVKLLRSTIMRFDDPDPKRKRESLREMRFIAHCSKVVQARPLYSAALALFNATFTKSMKQYYRVHYLGQFTILLRMLIYECRKRRAQGR